MSQLDILTGGSITTPIRVMVGALCATPWHLRVTEVPVPFLDRVIGMKVSGDLEWALLCFRRLDTPENKILNI